MSVQNQPAPTFRSHRAYRFGFFWPVLLVALGIVLLLNNTNVLPGNAWEWIWRLWPIMFITIGLDSLIRHEFVGATLMICLGGVFLAANFGFITLDVWEVIVRLWPLFLISAGLGLIFDRRWQHGLGAIIGVVAILAILAASMVLVNAGGQVLSWGTGQTIPSQKIAQPLNGAKTANVNIEPALGILTIKAQSESGALVDGTVNLQGSEQLVQNGSVDGGNATYLLRNNGTYVGFGPYPNDWHKWNLQLAPDIPMVLNIKMAAGENNLDLSQLKVTDLNVDMAVGSSSIILPPDASMTAKVSNAIGSLNITTAPGTAVRIVYSGALSTISVPTGYVHNGSSYSSANYESAAHRIDLHVSQAIGTLNVREAQDQIGR